MIHALDKNAEYLLPAKWFKREEILQQLPPTPQSLTSKGVFFRCKLINSISQEGTYPVKNLYTAGNSMTVETLYNIDIRVNDYVLINEQWWSVSKVYVEEVAVKEKTLGLARLNYSNKKTTIDLIETIVDR